MDELQTSLQWELIQSLASLYKSEEYSDFKITCGSETHRVHKAVVFPRSKYFAASSRFGGKEADTAEITLEDDEPQHVKAMVHYFYHLNYAVPNPYLANSTTKETGNIPDVPPEPSKQHSNDDLFAIWRQLPKQKKMLAKERRNALRSPEEYPCLIFHAKMYALADKYNIKGLKLLARERFAKAVNIGYKHEEFPDTIRVVFDTTLDSDTGLREPVIEVIFQHSELLDDPEVEAAVKDIPNLAFELLKRHRNSTPVDEEPLPPPPPPSDSWR